MDSNRGPELASVLGIVLSLATVFVCLRLYVKTFLSKSWGVDDGLLIVGWIFFTTYCACSATGIHYGTGRHLTDIPRESIPKALYFWWLCELFYTVTTVFIRLCIAVFLLRICIKPTHKYIIYGTLSMVVVFSMFYFFLVLFQCTPYSYFWDQYEGKTGSCIDYVVVPDASIAHSVVSFAADWILGLLPVALIYDLKMNIRTKLSVACLLGLGLLAGIAALIRIPFIKTLSITDDFLFATTDVAIWSTVEPGLGLIAIGGATLRPLFRSFYNLSTHTRSNLHPRSNPISHLKSNPKSRSKSNPKSPTPATRSGYLKRSDSLYGSEGPHNDEIQLRPDILRAENGNQGTITSIGSPFGDSREVVNGDWSTREGTWNGRERTDGKGRGKREGEGVIKVSKTVVVSRVESDASSVGSAGEAWGCPTPR